MHKTVAAGTQFTSVLQFVCPSLSLALHGVEMQLYQLPQSHLLLSDLKIRISFSDKS